eukprot:GILI01012995.1.p1 GENE.GILI01012995.1~~GILI01012995.1.p1  ORF type:complete len:484 (-),score=44.73 GILI01012995.1:24-1475(-)
MACVSILVGQCGNQLGASIYNTIAAEATQSNDELYQSVVSRTFFREPAISTSSSSAPVIGEGGMLLPETRSILVDMEPKVINDSIANAKNLGLYSVSPKQCVAKEEGSANNWAFGYYHQGASRRDDIADNLRKEAEEGGSVGSYQIIHSLAGGTGSGVGTLCSEIVRDEFPKALLMHTAVLPFSHGEVITQWYNMIFALSHINETADSVVLLANDDFSQAIQQSSGETESAERSCYNTPNAVSLHDINNQMSATVGSLWLPSSLLTPPPRVLRQNKVGNSLSPGRGPTSIVKIRPSAMSDIVELVSSDPRQKFLVGSCFPNYTRGKTDRNYKNGTWATTIGSALRKQRQNSSSRYLLTLRGKEAFCETDSEARSTGYTELGHSLALNSDVLPPDAIHASNTPFGGETAFVSLFDTSTTVGTRMANAAHRAERMFSVNAFTHHFHRFGASDEDFRNSLFNTWYLSKGYGLSDEDLEFSESDDEM